MSKDKAQLKNNIAKKNKCELPVKLTLDDTNDVFSRFSAYFEQQNQELINSTQNTIKFAINGVNKPFFQNES